MTDDELIAASRDAFLDEARDMLRQFESALLALADGVDPETVNCAFRAAHTIKGTAGLFGFSRVVHFTHEVEALLERVRAGQLGVTDAMVTVLLECRDQIERLLAEVAGSDASDDNAAESGRLIAMLRRVGGMPAELPLPADRPVGTAVPAARPAGVEVGTDIAPADGVAGDADEGWLIHIRFHEATFVNGIDPLSFLRYLPTVGEVLGIETLCDRVPPLDQFDAEACHIGFAVRLRTEADRAAIESVFQFAADDCDLTLVPPGHRTEDMLRLIGEVDDSQARLGEILVRIGALTPTELERLLARQREQSPDRRLGEVILDRNVVPPPLVQAAVQRQEKLRDRRSEESRVVRVAADKLDGLITLIGELVIAGSTAQVMAERAGDAGFLEVASRIRKLVEDARDGALRLRMVPIGETFARFRRVVHEVGRSLDKDVELVVTGAEAELDKAMVEQIVDPLTHLVRNALDHGLEPPAERVAAGKPPTGRLTLSAHHESGSIVIEVCDDGRGLSRDRILAKAVERGLITADAVPSDDEVHQLVFLPGFSTAAQVTDISGRGVGMDVVRRNIEALRGEVRLSSREGHGSTVQFRLPLTLAIIDGFRIEVAGSQFIIPHELVVECIEQPPEVQSLDPAAGAGCFDLRGEVMPFLSLQQHFQLEPVPGARRSVVVVRIGMVKVGILVDRLLGEHQTVIKPLGRLFSRLKGISGSTILGSGGVALILDVPALVASAERCAGDRPAVHGGPARRSTPPVLLPHPHAAGAATA